MRPECDNHDGAYIRPAIEEDGRPSNETVFNAVKDYLMFEQETSPNYPFKIMNPTEEQIAYIATMCMSDDTDEIHENCEKVLGTVHGF